MINKEALRKDCLKADFFSRPTSSVAQNLIGCILITVKNNKITGGRIVETEAYLGEEDKASHASVGITKRNEVMYGPPGYIYVYLIYGIHNCFNIVTESNNKPGAVLIRAVKPEYGIEIMKGRRSKTKVSELTNGPAKLTKALGIDLYDNKTMIGKKGIYILKNTSDEYKICRSRRIGITKSRDLKLRYYADSCRFVSGYEVTGEFI